MSSFADCFVVPTVLVRTTWFLTGVAVISPTHPHFFSTGGGKARAVLVSWTADVMCKSQSRNLVLFHPLRVKKERGSVCAG